MNPTETMKQAIIERAAQLVAERMFEEMNQSPAQYVPPAEPKQSHEDAEWTKRMQQLASAQLAARGLIEVGSPQPNHSLMPRRRHYGGNPIVMRGKLRPGKAYRKGSMEGRAMQLAWDSLHEDGHFASGRAAREDLTRYLIESLPDTPSSGMSSTISRALKRNVLAVLPEGF